MLVRTGVGWGGWGGVTASYLLFLLFGNVYLGLFPLCGGYYRCFAPGRLARFWFLGAQSAYFPPRLDSNASLGFHPNRNSARMSSLTLNSVAQWALSYFSGIYSPVSAVLTGFVSPRITSIGSPSWGTSSSVNATSVVWEIRNAFLILLRPPARFRAPPDFSDQLPNR